MDFQASLRQLRYPKEFRIPPPAWPGEAAVRLQEIAELLRKPVHPDGLNPKFLSGLGTGLWRLRNKMVQPETGRPLEEMRRAYRHFESVWDALAAQGVKVYDHTGEPFEPGRLLRVMSFQPMTGLLRDTIIETIMPTVYFKDDLIQQGEVIVGTPDEAAQSH
jgi:hypothetical protein